MRRHLPTLATLAALAALAALVLLPPILRGGPGSILGLPDADMRMQFYAWRAFGFGELARGRFPLWNPHLFAGAPYFGGVQGGLLYPLNLPFLVLPLGAAINSSYIVHVWIVGALMFLWARVRGLTVSAGFAGGTIVMFGGPFFPHILAGHLPHINTMAWAPLVFCAIDGWLGQRRPAWLLAGAGAVALQIVAGFPQVMFYTAVAATLYAGARWLQSARSFRDAAGLIAIYPFGAAIGAVQLVAALIASDETIRGEAVPWRFASAVSFPPENFLTMAAPHILGAPGEYWGRSYFWEASLFVGAVALVLAFAALRNWRRHWPALVVLGAALLFAMGRYTPVYRFFFDYIPGFGNFRGSAKFVFPASLMLALLAAEGLDSLFAPSSRGIKAWLIAAGLAGAALVVGGFIVRELSAQDWSRLVVNLGVSDENYGSPRSQLDPAFIASARGVTAGSFFVAGGFALAACAAGAARHRGWAPWAVAGLAAAELCLFARSATPVFRWDQTTLEKKRAALAALLPGERVFSLVGNDAMLLGADDAWGYDAMIPRRYAQFIAWTQGLDPTSATQNIELRRLHPLMTIVRLKLAVADTIMGTVEQQPAPAPPMPRLALMSQYKLAEGRDAVFAAMTERSFNPFRTVVLETPPSPLPSPSAAAGTALIVDEETDAMEIETETAAPAILVVTDAWTPGWRAVALEGSAQHSYEVLPADWCIRAIPLGAGSHRIRLEYAPAGLAAGRWISGLALGAWCAAWFMAGRRTDRTLKAALPPTTIGSADPQGAQP